MEKDYWRICAAHFLEGRGFATMRHVEQESDEKLEGIIRGTGAREKERGEGGNTERTSEERKPDGNK